MKARLIPLLLLLALLLTACGAESAEESPSPAAPTPVEEAEPTETPAPLEDRVLPALDLEGSQAMACFLNANRVLLQAGRLYCYDFDENWEPALSRYTWAGGKLQGYTVLAKGCIPEYLCGDGEYLYYIDRTGGAIERVPEKGGAREQLREGPCEGLALRDGRLYFLDGEGSFLSTDTDGGDEKLLLEGPCAFAYPLEGCILCRDERDGGRLHLCRTEDGSDEALTHGPASTPLLYGDRLWYDDGTELRSLDAGLLDEQSFALPERSGAIELLPGEDGLLLRGFLKDKALAQWAGAPEGPFEQQGWGYRICDWLGGGIRVDTVYQPDGRIRFYLLTDGTGAEITFLAGKIN